MAFEKKQTGSDSPDTGSMGTAKDREEEREERKRGGAHKRAAGGAIARKSGGMIPGHKSEHRPDKRARGGGVSGSDMHPMSSAGNMSSLPFEKGSRPNKDEGGSGGDKNTKGFG